MSSVMNKIEEGATWVELSLSHKLDGGCPCGATETATYQLDGSGYARYLTTKIYHHKSIRAN